MKPPRHETESGLGMNKKLASRPLAKRREFRRAILAAASSLIFAAAAADPMAVQKNNGDDLMERPLEELMKLQVTSVSKRPELLSDAAAAVFVITQDDIRRSGATSIPEALRLSPGLDVARQDSHTWAISSRGFNDEFANQLLVLIDGRSVYTPLFAGVYWDVQDLVLEDIDRIEVIRGPGATLWGANAVNGVINITTKSAKETQGGLLIGGGGTEEHGFSSIRYGGKVGQNGYYRVYGKFFNRDDSALPDGSRSHDEWTMSRGGFRYDWEPNDFNTLTVQGDMYGGELNQSVRMVNPAALRPPFAPPFAIQNNHDVDVSGGNLLSRWTHKISSDSDLSVKLYYDRTDRDRVVFAEKRNTFDIDAQHRFSLLGWNDIIWGLGYNITEDELKNTASVTFSPRRRSANLYSAFLQDEITVVPDKLRLTLGSKLEHNDYTGWEIQPSGRLSWSITHKQTAWAAVSRAVSTPSRAEDDIRITPSTGIIAPGGVVSLFGSRGMESKELIAYELGYRVQPHDRVSLDFTAFYNIYDRQRSIEPGGTRTPAPPPLVIPFTINNLIHGETYGFEVASTFQLTDWWRVRANYSYLKIDLHMSKGAVSNPFQLNHSEGDSPQNQVGVRSHMDLPYNFEFDTGVRYVDSLPNRGVGSYIVGDARIGWRSPNKKWEISVVGQNLFNSRHQEFAPSYIETQTTEVETSVYGKVTFRF
jgi:iron complex outermembrane receptor protein